MSVLVKDETPKHIPPSEQSAQGPVPKPGEPLVPRVRTPAVEPTPQPDVIQYPKTKAATLTKPSRK